MAQISVIIPTYNRRDLLQATLESVRRNILRDTEILVVDDGSTDDTRDYLQKQEDIRWFPQRNAGPSAARNLGAANAKGTYLAFLDSDDLWFPWTLACYHRVIAETEAAFIAGKPYRFSDVADLESIAEGPLQTLTFADYLASGDDWRWWGCSSFLVRKEAFKAVGGFNGSHINAEDADFAMRMGTSGPFVQIRQPSTFAYREHASSEMKNVALNVAGATHLLETQLAGAYPGGPTRNFEQWRILSRHLRPVALAGLRQNQRALAWRIYRATLPHHIRTLRLKFILGFLLKAFK